MANHYVGLILVIMWGYTFSRLRFGYAALTSLIIIAGYEIVAIAYQHLLASPQGLVIFISSNFFL